MSFDIPRTSNIDPDIFFVFRDYIHFCNQEQMTLNNLLHTQNLLSNNRYSMFNLMFRHINPQTTAPTMAPPTFNFNTTQPPFNLNRTRRTPRVWTFPNRRESILTPSRTTLNPLQEFINAANTTTQTSNRRRSTTMRQFFENCEIFIYSQDTSNNQIRCPISMTDFTNNDICVRLPCNHIFKIRPLLQWFSRARTCPLCRRSIISRGLNTDIFDTSGNNASVQTTDISNGFIADVSANSMEALSSALTRTLTSGIQNLFNNIDSSNNDIPTLFTTNISLLPSRDYRQSPININDTSGNTIEPVD